MPRKIPINGTTWTALQRDDKWLRDVVRSARDIAGSTADIKAAVATGFSAIRTLDTIVANSLTTEPAMMAAWRSSWGVEGRSRSNGEPPFEPMPDTANGATASAAVTDDMLKRAL